MQRTKGEFRSCTGGSIVWCPKSERNQRLVSVVLSKNKTATMGQSWIWGGFRYPHGAEEISNLWHPPWWSQVCGCFLLVERSGPCRLWGERWAYRDLVAKKTLRYEMNWDDINCSKGDKRITKIRIPQKRLEFLHQQIWEMAGDGSETNVIKGSGDPMYSGDFWGVLPRAVAKAVLSKR